MTTNIPSTDDGEADQLGAFVREHRDKLGLSQRQLATRAGIDNGYVSRMERGRIGAVSQPILRRLANALEVEPEDLYTVSGYVTPQSLPGYSAYLRTKYEMSDDAARELTRFFDDLATRHDIKEREQNQKLSDDNT
jgi:transcriptional regulator with XRE-family HTH domain